MDTIDGKDKDSVRRIFSLTTMVMPYDPVPRVLLDKQTMSLALNKRADEVKLSMTNFVNQAVQPDGSIDWTCGFPYNFEWNKEGTRVVSCANMFDEKHIMEEHEVVTDSFSFASAFDPRQAAVSKGGMRILLCDLFGPGSKMAAMTLDKKATRLAALGETASLELQERTAASMSGKIDEGRVVLQDTVLRENRKRAAEAARAKQAENKKKRQGTVDLSSIASKVPVS